MRCLNVKSAGLYFLLLSGLCFSACSDEKDGASVAEEASASISFSFDSKAVTTKTVDENNLIGDCDATDWGNYILSLDHVNDATNDTTTVTKNLSYYIDDNGEHIVSEPIDFVEGSHTIIRAEILDASSNTVYSGVVGSDAIYSVYIPEGEHMGEKKITVGGCNGIALFTKQTVGLYVLCSEYDKAENFGMAKFFINSISLSCFDMMVDVCDPTRDDEHEVGTGTVKIFTEDGLTLLHQDAFDAEDMAQICFADNNQIADEDEIYIIEVTLTNSFLIGNPVTLRGKASVKDLKEYKEFSTWKDAMNALDVVYCGDDLVINKCTTECCEISDIILEKDAVTINEPDFLVFTFAWERSAGTDLDVAVQMEIEDLDGVAGWGFNISNPYLIWGGDNRNDGKECVFIDLKTFKTNYAGYSSLGNNIITDCYLNWYERIKSGKVSYTIQAYKGGSMIKTGYYFVNNGGTLISESTFTNKVTAFGQSPYIPSYQKVCVIDFNKSTNDVTITNIAFSNSMNSASGNENFYLGISDPQNKTDL